MLALTMNDSAAQLLGTASGVVSLGSAEDAAPRLRDLLAQGITRRSDVLVWVGSVGIAEHAPSIFPDLTGWECADSSFHIEDFVPVTIDLLDGEPRIGEADQPLLLQHRIAFALRFSRLVYELDTPVPVRCIISANETNATFRFHQIRVGQSWNRPNLDDYQLEKIVVLDISPDRSR